MENASKALIIAGSILLSILIIALGMFIFSSSSSTSDGMTTTLSENEKQTFNIKFEKYNDDQQGSNVLSLISAARSNATANRNAAEEIPTVTYYGRGAKNATATATGGKELTDDTELQNYMNELSKITNDVERSHKYHVTLGYNTAGLVNAITITYGDTIPEGKDGGEGK